MSQSACEWVDKIFIHPSIERLGKVLRIPAISLWIAPGQEIRGMPKGAVVAKLFGGAANDEGRNENSSRPLSADPYTFLFSDWNNETKQYCLNIGSKFIFAG